MKEWMAIFRVWAVLGVFGASLSAQNMPAQNPGLRLPGGIQSFLSAPVAQANANKKSFTLRGVVEAVDAKAGRVTVNHEKVEGWMDAMTMAYAVDKPEELQKVKPGDHIEATVYQDEYKLYNIRVTASK